MPDKKIKKNTPLFGTKVPFLKTVPLYCLKNKKRYYHLPWAIAQKNTKITKEVLNEKNIFVDDDVQIIHGFSFTYTPGRNFISGSVNLIKVF